MMKSVLAATLLALGASAWAQQTVSFVEPVNGATVSSPFKVRFAVAGMSVKPAGDMTANTGHHHLLINTTPVKAGEVIPVDDKHLHFGKGQTETELTLPPGNYTLTMQFANGLHQAYGPGMNKEIKITVK
ncbi:DUF4399 domain-containing protein [Pseudoduganella sp. FT25W]|uniref:DUF4399 domain-containing protein n=1 Tax=Duganella alba TaxID=2666081 RepID=A0A6L5QM20_9BURK|nr:DUF4399 domain-containing protein [Duganella alba]MRX10854.1 DUF4399 domain-containing protein [Duganella alba]MRX16546.1 DUF4399 domain-containing protein [Duganella alba]